MCSRDCLFIVILHLSPFSGSNQSISLWSTWGWRPSQIYISTSKLAVCTHRIHIYIYIHISTTTSWEVFIFSFSKKNIMFFLGSVAGGQRRIPHRAEHRSFISVAMGNVWKTDPLSESITAHSHAAMECFSTVFVVCLFLVFFFLSPSLLKSINPPHVARVENELRKEMSLGLVESSLHRQSSD